MRVIRLLSTTEHLVVPGLFTSNKIGELSPVLIVSDERYEDLKNDESKDGTYIVVDMPLYAAGSPIPSTQNPEEVAVVVKTDVTDPVNIDWQTFDSEGFLTCHVSTISADIPITAIPVDIDANIAKASGKYIIVSWDDGVTIQWCGYKVMGISEDGKLVYIDRDRNANITAGATVNFIEGYANPPSLTCTV